MSRRTKWIVVALGAAAVLAALPVAGLALLGPEWLKGKLVEAARERLNAQLQIESLSFSPFGGEAELKGIEFDRKTEGSDVHATLGSLRLKLRMWPLLFRSIEIDRLEADHPKIVWTVRQPPDSERASTWEKLKRMAGGWTRASDRNVEFLVHHLILREGALDFTSLREGREPFKARATEIRYSATSVSLNSFGRLVYGADIDAKIDLGGVPASLRKRGSTKPATFALTGINLAHADRYFDPSDALVMSGGTLDLGYTLGGDQILKLRADFRGLELGENPAAASQEFAFVPVGRLRELVKSRGGDLSLEFTIEARAEASEDLRVLLDEVWTGIWAALIKSMSSGAIRAAFDKGKQKALDHLKPQEKK